MFDDIARRFKTTAYAPFLWLGAGLSPNIISTIGLVFGLIAAVFAANQLYWAGLGLWLLNRAWDGLDGEIARKTEQQSDFGGYLDIIYDHIAYTSVPLGLALGLNTPLAWIAVAVLLGCFYINAASWMYLSAIFEKRNLGARANSEKTSVTMPSGLIAGVETIIFFCAFFIFPNTVPILFFAMGGLVLVGVVQRLVWAYQRLN